VRAVGVASAVAGYLGQQHIIISFFVCTRRAGAVWRLPSRGREVINHKTWVSAKMGGEEYEF